MARSASTAASREPTEPSSHHASTAATAAGGAGGVLVDEVVERAEDEVEAVDVVAHVGGEQAAGERERPPDAAGRAPRLGQERVGLRLRPLQQHERRPPSVPAGRGWSWATRPAVTSAPRRTPGIPAPGCVPPPTW